jgi:D-arabinose 1-dehydrogenase-like Zn-dependent alcohol dehydrogenase
MRAAVLRAFGQPLEMRELEVPAPSAGEVLVRVRAVGLCGTDLKITGGAFATTPLPMVPGHEVAGELADGRRVACYVYEPCGRCRTCRRGFDTLCPTSTRIGFDKDGGLAEYVKVREHNALPFADHVPFESAAVAMDAGTSPWRALMTRAQVGAGETVVIAGAGGLGTNGVQIARHAGARVAVVDPVARSRTAALAAGAELAVDPGAAEALIEWSGGGADVGFEASGARAGFDTLVRCLRPGARLVCCGYQVGIEYGLDSAALVLNEITLLGSRNGSRSDAESALRALETGALRPVIGERLPLQDVNRGLDRLRRGDATGRIVVLPG